MEEKETRLLVQNVSKSFGKVKALTNAFFDLKVGEIHAFIGENGAGKSTLMRIINGETTKDSGKIIYEGEEITSLTPKKAQEKGIYTIHQELSLIEGLSVYQNIYIGDEFSKNGFINDKKMRKEAENSFTRCQFDVDLDAQVGDLTAGDKQLVEIVKAIRHRPHILILDEPTTSLSSVEVSKLFRVLNRLKEKNVSIIFISHKLDEIFEISDRITVLRDGEFVGAYNTNETNKDELISNMVGRSINLEIKKKSNVKKDAETFFEVKKLSTPYVRNCSFYAKKGEIVGFSGLVGSGRSALMKGIIGMHKVLSGKIIYKGKECKINNPCTAKKMGICYLSEERNEFGLMLENSVFDNTNLGNFDLFAKYGFEDAEKATQEAERYNALVKTKYSDIHEQVKNLSGGNRQKVIVARWLEANLDLFIFDEPTKGIDVAAKSETYQIIKDLAEEGKTIIVVSSEILELQMICDRIYVMSEGTISGCVPIEEATQESIMKLATKGEKHD